MGVYAVSSTSINLDTWKRLSPAVQKTIDEVAAKVPDHYASIMDGMVDKAVDSLIAAGKTKVVLMSDAEKKRVRDAVAKPLWDKWIAAASQRGVDGEIGRAHVWTHVTTAHRVCRLLLSKKNTLSLI